MSIRIRFSLALLAFAIGLAIALAIARKASAHCDTMDGPVVKAARTALAKGDPTPVLKWIKSSDEADVRAVFRQTLAVRRASPQAKELADRFFFETVVRIHRAGEGEPYTGLKPAGTPIEPAVAEADRALDTGSVDRLVGRMQGKIAAGLRQRFADAVQKKKHAEDSVQAGREYVESYVEFVHYAEKIDDASGKSPHHGLHGLSN